MTVAPMHVKYTYERACFIHSLDDGHDENELFQRAGLSGGLMHV